MTIAGPSTVVREVLHVASHMFNSQSVALISGVVRREVLSGDCGAFFLAEWRQP